jgi:hypothetical protein
VDVLGRGTLVDATTTSGLLDTSTAGSDLLDTDASTDTLFDTGTSSDADLVAGDTFPDAPATTPLSTDDLNTGDALSAPDNPSGT